MNNLAILYRNQGRYDEAEPLYLETLEARRRISGDDHPHTLSSKHNLAVLYWNQGRYDEAEPLYLETLEARKRVLGDDHPDTLKSMNNLAILYVDQGRYDEAEPILIETLEIRKRVLGDDHPDTASTLYDLACLETLRGDRAKAMDWLGQSVDAGYANADHMGKGSDLESLHGPEFNALVERARQNAEAQRAK
jgi:tetratricopeptide (TPR) repeat protein